MTVRAFHIKTRKCQAFWRSSRGKLAVMVHEIERRWAKIEEEMVIEIVKHEQSRENKKPREKKNKPNMAARLTMTDFVAVRMTQKNVVHDFIMAELRVERFNFITKRDTWEMEYREYVEERQNWRDDKKARIAIGLEAKKVPPPELPPYPSVRPTDAHLTEWIRRCRKDPANTRPVPISKFQYRGKAGAKAEGKSEVEVKKAEAVLMSARDHLPHIPHKARQTGMLIIPE